MNIFYLSEDPNEAARWMVDRHVVKMILETAQLLSTAHRVLDGEETVSIVNGRKKKKWIIKTDERDAVLYSATHINHPCAIWARQSVENYNWLFDHFIALGQEYTYRYDKIHKSFGVRSLMLSAPPHNLKDWDWTTPPSAMAPEYVVIPNDPIVNYRNYYKLGKAKLHSWKRRDPPDWIKL